ncbi:hypothetical protein HKI87_04g29510 [Chloropicon roscoffensis]|uniref:Uncharacterized protein n=1 Tax=Chloropicon roscoffensis TaxID=1461544 RepID=A0A7S3C7U3_9CHLO|mmetsp:Transcript_11774/g.35804  ORF Transcript_11774/g.35804 Transcript_11774/m.35804 type:complete len:117 (+) Transcript_11774:80-430(+)
MSGLAFQGLKRGLAVVVAEGRAVAPLASWRAPFASASDSFTDKFNKKEAAEERLYFNKEDEKLLRGLLGKMKAQAETSDKFHSEKEKQALMDIVGRYDMDNKDVERLLDWRHSHDF